MSEEKQSKRPTHGIYQVTGDGEKARWFKIGAAWMHKDIKGAMLILDVLPLTNKLQLRELRERDEAATEDATSDSGGQK